jgi:hypothetical protein
MPALVAMGGTVAINAHALLPSLAGTECLAGRGIIATQVLSQARPVTNIHWHLHITFRRHEGHAAP